MYLGNIMVLQFFLVPYAYTDMSALTWLCSSIPNTNIYRINSHPGACSSALSLPISRKRIPRPLPCKNGTTRLPEYWIDFFSPGSISSEGLSKSAPPHLAAGRGPSGDHFPCPLRFATQANTSIIHNNVDTVRWKRKPWRLIRWQIHTNQIKTGFGVGSLS